MLFLIILILDVLHSSVTFLIITAQNLSVLFIVFNDYALLAERLYPKVFFKDSTLNQTSLFCYKILLNVYIIHLFFCSPCLFLYLYGEKKKILKLHGCYLIIFQRKNYLTHRIPMCQKFIILIGSGRYGIDRKQGWSDRTSVNRD